MTTTINTLIENISGEVLPIEEKKRNHKIRLDFDRDYILRVGEEYELINAEEGIDDLSHEIGLEANSLRNSGWGWVHLSERTVGVDEKVSHYQGIAQFVGFMNAIENGINEQGKPLYPALKGVNERARSGYGHNNPRTGLFVHEYRVVTHGMNKEGKSPGALERKIWAVKEAALRKHGVRISFEIALEAIGIVRKTSKGATVAVALMTGLKVRSYREARDILVTLILNTALLKKASKMRWLSKNVRKFTMNFSEELSSENLYEAWEAYTLLRQRRWRPRDLFTLEIGEICRLAAYKGDEKIVDLFQFTSHGRYVNWNLWDELVDENVGNTFSTLMEKYRRIGLSAREALITIKEIGSKVNHKVLETEMVEIEGVKSYPLSKEKRVGLYKVQKHLVKGVYDQGEVEWVIKHPLAGGYHIGNQSFKFGLEQARLAFTQRLIEHATKEEVVKIVKGDEVCHLVFLEDSYAAGNCVSGTYSWVEQNGLTGQKIISLRKLNEIAEGNSLAKKVVELVVGRILGS